MDRSQIVCIDIDKYVESTKTIAAACGYLRCFQFHVLLRELLEELVDCKIDQFIYPHPGQRACLEWLTQTWLGHTKVAFTKHFYHDRVVAANQRMAPIVEIVRMRSTCYYYPNSISTSGVHWDQRSISLLASRIPYFQPYTCATVFVLYRFCEKCSSDGRLLKIMIRVAHNTMYNG